MTQPSLSTVPINRQIAGDILNAMQAGLAESRPHSCVLAFINKTIDNPKTSGREELVDLIIARAQTEKLALSDDQEARLRECARLRSRRYMLGATLIALASGAAMTIGGGRFITSKDREHIKALQAQAAQSNDPKERDRLVQEADKACDQKNDKLIMYGAKSSPGLLFMFMLLTDMYYQNHKNYKRAVAEIADVIGTELQELMDKQSPQHTAAPAR